MRIGKTGVCLAICVGLMSAGAWAGQQHSDTMTHKPAAEQNALKHAWTVNGMQVIEITPAQRKGIHALRQPHGSSAIPQHNSKQTRLDE